MGIEAGKLRKRITFQNPTGTRNETGEVLIRDPRYYPDDYTDYYTCWASIEPLAGKELVNAQQIQADVDTKIVCRFVAGLDTDTTRIIKYGSRFFNIVDARNVDEYGEALEIHAVERK